MRFKLAVLCFFFFFLVGLSLMVFNQQWITYKQFSEADMALLSYVLYPSMMISPWIFGIIADKWIDAKYVFSFLSFGAGVALCIVPLCNSFSNYYFFTYLATLLVVPNLVLFLRIVFNGLEQANLDITDGFPKIRFWGNFGFYLAVFATVLFIESQRYSLAIYAAALIAFLLGFYVLFLPGCPPAKLPETERNLFAIFGPKGIFNFKNKRVGKFLLLSIFSGILLVLAGSYSPEFIQKQYDALNFNSASSRKPFVGAVMALTEFSKILFIFTIPFFIRKLGYKKTIQTGFWGWIAYTGIFVLVNAYDIKWLLLISSCLFGIAVNFHYITSILIIEKEGNPKFKTTSQALYILCASGIAGLIRTIFNRVIIPDYFTKANNVIDWTAVWICLTILAIFVTGIFALLFRNTEKEHLI